MELGVDDASLLGTWLAGGACMPVDVKTPEARLRGMIEDAESRVLLARRDDAGLFAWVATAGLRVGSWRWMASKKMFGLAILLGAAKPRPPFSQTQFSKRI